MIWHRFYYLFLFLTAVLFGMSAYAQTDVTDVSSVGLDEAAVSSVERDWDTVATTAEETLAGPTPSLFRLNRLRDDLVNWRDQFANGENINAGRIATVEGQIAALGVLEEGESEPEPIANRRAELETLLSELRAPSLLAQESHARANGMISEVDTLLRGRDAQTLSTRIETPLNPASWPDAMTSLGLSFVNLGSETVAKTRADVISGQIWRNLPFALIFLVIAGVLLLKGRVWVVSLQGQVDSGTARSKAVWSFLLSLWQVILPFLGLLALTAAFERLNVLGDAGSIVLDSVFSGVLIVIVAMWLRNEIFPLTSGEGPLRYDAPTRVSARSRVVWLAWLAALFLVARALMRSIESSAVSTNVVVFPILVALGIAFFSFSRLIRRDPAVPEGYDPELPAPRGRARRFVGGLCMVIAVLTPILSAAGYAAAAAALILPTLITIAILGFVLLLQRFVNDLWLVRSGDEQQGGGSLAPVLISFGLLVLALPVLALVWGARVDDLSEIWTRFSEGFAIGETRISPADFVTFATVFAVGYVLTRFIQGTLRTSVLPRTRMDLGGQNAVVAGFGYVGIFLSAIIAVTMAGIDLSSIAIVAGALSVGIGFGLQNIVSNFISGIILLIERPIGEGDWIEVNGTMGYVRDISVRSTRIETFDRTDVIIPNADLISGQVTNWTRGNAVGRVIVPVGVAYGTDTKLVMDILEEVATSHPMVLLNPPPGVLFLEFGDNSLNFEIRAILRDVNFVLGVKSELNLEIEKRFKEAGIEIPFPQRDLWIRNAEDLKGTP